jgi:hypothetical protein
MPLITNELNLQSSRFKNILKLPLSGWGTDTDFELNSTGAPEYHETDGFEI